jgi:hypothetical protein
MNIRKLLKHRARLSYLKPYGYLRGYKGQLIMWNMNGYSKNNI